MFEGLDWQEES